MKPCKNIVSPGCSRTNSSISDGYSYKISERSKGKFAQNWGTLLMRVAKPNCLYSLISRVTCCCKRIIKSSIPDPTQKFPGCTLSTGKALVFWGVLSWWQFLQMEVHAVIFSRQRWCSNTRQQSVLYSQGN